jgi:hypothetical protein
MAKWSEDHMVAVGSLNLNFGIFGRIWLNWRPNGALRLTVETAGYKGQGVVCEKPAPPRL